MPDHRQYPAGISRRTFLAAAGVGLGGLALAACSRSAPSGSPTAVSEQSIAAAESRRPHSGRVVTHNLVPQSAEIDLGGPKVRTLVYGDSIPVTAIRANVGDELAVSVDNRLDHPTSVHWHGIALRNDMDGAAPASPNISAGDIFTYRFSVPHSGTYWAHPHAGLDTDYGLYLPVIVDDPNEPGAYDAEWIVVLDDWTDGVGKGPQTILDDLRRGGMGSMGHGGTSDMPGMSGMPGMGAWTTGSPSPNGPMSSGVGRSALLGGDAGDVSYPYYLVNGRVPEAPTSFTAKPSQRVRIRIINAGADTAFRIALAEHRMTVTHTDGFPVQPVEVDALLLGMGERYDVVVTAKDGVFPLVALAEGKNGQARALLATGAGTAPPVGFEPAELRGRVGTLYDFVATENVMLAPGRPDVELKAELGGDMMTYVWTVNGRTFDDTRPLTIHGGQRARLTFSNMTMMWHPVHLHGHTFQVVNPGGSRGARKDTAIILPMQSVAVDFVADNPGEWMLHCHNAYHQEAGMMTQLNYLA